MLKLRFAVPGMMTAYVWKPDQQLLSLVNLAVVVSDNYFFLVPFILLGVLSERSGFNLFPYSILIGGIIFYDHVHEALQLPVDHQLGRYYFDQLFSRLGK